MYSLETFSSLDQLAVEKFQEYLRIPSVHPNVNYGSCVTFLENYAKDLGLELNVYLCFPTKPIVILTWKGTEPTLASVLLNSHMDVVPVFEEKWTYNPFAAHIDDDGNIYARGSQDTKCLGIQYLEAIRRLQLDKVRLKRTVHVSFVPDEEIGGAEGLKAFVETPEFKNLNIAFALDEGAPCHNNDFYVFPSEKWGCQFSIHCPGTPGHGSIMYDNTAGEKVHIIMNKLFELRKKSKSQVKSLIDHGDVVSVNLTMLQGGVQHNVLPSELILVIDARIPPSIDEKEWDNIITEWCIEAGKDVWIEYHVKEPQSELMKLDASNPFWMTFKNCMEKKGNLVIKPLIACTDARYLRKAGVLTIGFAPNNNTPIKAHGDDEFLNVNVFLNGVAVYCDLIPEIANT